jgi:hypothetical protein
VPLVVTAVAAARQQVVEASRQAVVQQVAAAVPRWAVKEAALLVVPAPLWPLARVNRCASFSIMMRYRLTRTSLCRSGCGGFPTLGRALPRSPRRPRLTRRPRTGGPWKRAVVKRVAEEATMKAAANEEATGKTADEAAGAVRDSPDPGRAPEVVGTKRTMAPSGSTPLAKYPYMGV